MNYKKLIICLGLPQLAGLVGSIFTVSAIPIWYTGLQRPFFSPPNWIFGPAWILLYILMGISAYLIWQKGDKQSLRLFWIHLFFNATWSIIFFGLQSPFWALLNIIIIWLFIIILMIKFWKINRWATYLLVPYFLWVSFASILNYFIWYLN
ncbi:tryptophan-rich sensory protein [Patescibacteria group bacterium]|nr:tryptophan-rich sensory protein [Patescibacteria group bacterium]